jgi:hypothetical protein
MASAQIRREPAPPVEVTITLSGDETRRLIRVLNEHEAVPKAGGGFQCIPNEHTTLWQLLRNVLGE